MFSKGELVNREVENFLYSSLAHHGYPNWFKNSYIDKKMKSKRVKEVKPFVRSRLRQINSLIFDKNYAENQKRQKEERRKLLESTILYKLQSFKIAKKFGKKNKSDKYIEFYKNLEDEDVSKLVRLSTEVFESDMKLGRELILYLFRFINYKWFKHFIKEFFDDYYNLNYKSIYREKNEENGKVNERKTTAKRENKLTEIFNEIYSERLDNVFVKKPKGKVLEIYDFYVSIKGKKEKARAKAILIENIKAFKTALEKYDILTSSKSN